MAMVTPIGVSVNAFDANTQTQVFKFTTSGGNQVVGNILNIYINETQEKVLSKNVESYEFQQTYDPETDTKLVNGTQYYFTFQTYDIQYNNQLTEEENIANGHLSNESFPILFYCYTTPVIEITNIPLDSIINASSYNFIGSYNQAENELMDSAIFNLYTSNGELVATSGNIYPQSEVPTKVSYTFQRLDDNENYTLEFSILTINNTEVSISKEFKVVYEFPNVYSTLQLENKCRDGYVQITSNLRSIEGESNPTNLTYIDDTKVDICKDDYYVKWNHNFEIPENFLLRIRMTPARINENFCILGDKSSGNYFELKWVRENNSDTNVMMDCFVFLGYINNEIVVQQKSNYIDLMNNLSDVFIWVKKNGNDYELILHSYYFTPTIFQWGASNVEYNKNSTLVYENSEFEADPQYSPNTAGDISSLFPIKKVMIRNGIFDLINITKDTSVIFDEDAPTPIWTFDTIINCDFKNNINAGSIEEWAKNIKAIVVERKEVGTFNSIVLYVIQINKEEDFSFVVNDNYVPSYHSFEYSLYPIMQDGTEGTKSSESIDTYFDGIFISDKNNTYKLYEGVVFGGNTQNISIGQYQAIGNKYPIIIQNGEINYSNGSINGNLYGYNFEETRIIDRKDVVTQTNNLLTFLTNGTAKVIKDWNGNIWISRISGTPTTSFNNNYGMGTTNVSFNFVEQGQWNNAEDLYKNGLIDVLY